MKPPQRDRHPARRRALLAVVAATCLAAGLCRNAAQLTFTDLRAATLHDAAPPPPQLLFRCPDGRLGLHVVHTRFLITQAAANRVFVASRLQLMRTFFVPSLNAQTSQAFVVAAGFDPGLDASVVAALDDTLGLLRAHSLSGAEKKVYPTLTHSAVAAKLQHVDPRVHEVDVFITSRMDLDDAVHVGAVEGVQRLACSAGGHGGNRTSAAVRLVYMHKGALWYPSLGHPYGVTCEWTNNFVSHLAILQSMVLSGASFLRTCPLNVYSYPHYKPAALEEVLRGAPGCEGAAFNRSRHVHRWRPPGDGARPAALYTKTASSWSHGKLEHKGVECTPAAAEELRERFALAPAHVSLANLQFAGLEADAPGLLANSTVRQLER